MKTLKDLLNFSYQAKKSSFHPKKFEAFDFLSLVQNWPKIVGPYLSQHTIPLKNDRQTLTILSNHPTVAQEMSLLEEALKENILKYFPDLRGFVKRLKFLVNSEHFERQKLLVINSPTAKKVSKQIHPQSPIYKRMKKEAEKLIDTIEDEEMKDLLISLYIQKKIEDEKQD